MGHNVNIYKCLVYSYQVFFFVCVLCITVYMWKMLFGVFRYSTLRVHWGKKKTFYLFKIVFIYLIIYLFIYLFSLSFTIHGAIILNKLFVSLVILVCLRRSPA